MSNRAVFVAAVINLAPTMPEAEIEKSFAKAEAGATTLTSPNSWFHTCGWHAAHDWSRKQENEGRMALAKALVADEVAAEAKAAAEAEAEFLRLVPVALEGAHHQQGLHLRALSERYLGRKSAREIAEMLSVSEVCAQKWSQRGRELLAKHGASEKLSARLRYATASPPRPTPLRTVALSLRKAS
jgi:DNA-directed RNA polymerase specialized sigma24 family protein